MKELAQHIETLLLENDCVIIPNFGGFIAHYTPAKIDLETGQFLPPSRTIGFNPQLTINDGLLAQSYMLLHDANFPQASRMIEKEIKELSSQLHEVGKVLIHNIGELRYTMEGKYSFAPQSAKLNTTSLYGLESFNMKPLSMIRAEKIVTATIPRKTAEKNKEKEITLKPSTTIHHPGIGKSIARYAAVAAAAILFFFVLSKPIENNYSVIGNQANLFSADLFDSHANRSVTKSPILLPSSTAQNKKTSTALPKTSQPIVVKEVVVAKTEEAKPIATASTIVAEASLPKNNEISSTATVTAKNIVAAPAAAKPAAEIKKRFHVVVGSTTEKSKAETLLSKLKSQNHNDATIISNGERLRICINSYATREEAQKEVNTLRGGTTYNDAWLFVK